MNAVDGESATAGTRAGARSAVNCEGGQRRTRASRHKFARTEVRRAVLNMVVAVRADKRGGHRLAPRYLGRAVHVPDAE